MTPNTCWIFGLLLSSVFFRVCNTNSKYRVTYFDGDPLGLTLQPLFVDYSDLVRVVIVNWNRRSVCAYYYSVAMSIQILDPLIIPAQSVD